MTEPSDGTGTRPSEQAPVVVEPPVSFENGLAGQRQQAAPSDPFDLFAGLPRLSPLPADLELIPDSPPAASPAGPAGRDAAGGEQPVAGYHGRRRATEDDGSPTPPPGGRRRAPDDAPDDLLARIRRS